MNSFLNVQIRVLAAQAKADLKSIQTQLVALKGSQAAGAAGFAGLGAAGAASLGRIGSQLQGQGRQLTTNITLPLALAGGAATKLALDNEAAFVRIQKVYGDGTHSIQEYSNELNHLRTGFIALSEIYGQTESDTLNIAADWAAAGASGVALAKSVDLTMKTMVLGEMNAADSTTALISIQSQYGQNTEQLTKTIDTLNMIENQTGVSMEGLIDGFTRAAGVARTSGVDVQHLGAFIAALSPAAGSAAQAGNALKTIFSRITAPTKDANAVLGQLGINTTLPQWQSANGSQRLEQIAKAYNSLADNIKGSNGAVKGSNGQMISSQAGVIDSIIASRFQINKFDVLMRALGDSVDSTGKKTGYYAKALESTKDASAVAKQASSELMQVLNSDPQQFKRALVILENAASTAIIPLIPAFLGLANTIDKVVGSFSRMSPAVQQLVLYFLLFIAAIGPIVRVIGAVIQLVNFLGIAFGLVLKPIGLLFDAFGLISGAISAVLIPVLSFAGSAVIAFAGVIASVFQLIAAQMIRALAPITEWVLAQLAALAETAAGWVVWAAQTLALNAGVFAALVIYAGVFAVSWLYYQIQAIAESGIGWVTWAARTVALNVSVFAAAVVSAAVGMATWISEQSGVLLLSITSWVVWAARTVALNVGTFAYLVLYASVFAVSWLFYQAQAIASSLVEWVVWAARTVALNVGTFAYLALYAATFAVVWLFYQARAMAASIVQWVIWAARTVAVNAAVLAQLTAMWVRANLMEIFSNPWVLGAAVIIGVIYALRSQLESVWQSIVTTATKAFYALPASIQGAMMSMVKIVAAAVHEVYDLFSYINPFAKHSPSPVDNMKKGTKVMGDHFSTLPDNMAEPAKQANAHLNSVSQNAHIVTQAAPRGTTSVGGSGSSNGVQELAAGAKVANAELLKLKPTLDLITKAANNAQWAAMRKQISDAVPADLPTFDNLLAKTKSLTAEQTKLSGAITKQTAVVAALSAKVDTAKTALDAAQASLDKTKASAQVLTDAIDKANTAISDLANTPLTGMGAMDDAIFANTQAQNKLQLAIDQTQQAYGGFATAADAVAALNGEMEKLQGLQNTLRSQGAGSEITKPIQDQIDALKSQQVAANNTSTSVAAMNSQLDDLKKSADELNLEKSLNFDGAQRDIQKLIDGTKELSFDSIVNGITAQQAIVAKAQPQLDAYNNTIDRQQATVDKLTITYNNAQAAYNAQNDQLTKMSASYQQVTDDVQKLNQAMQDLASADTAKKAAKAKTPKLDANMQDMANAAGNGFPDPGGLNQVGREAGSATDQSAQIDAYIKKMQNDVGGKIGSVDMFGPLKEQFNNAVAWLNKHAPGLTDFIKKLPDDFRQAFTAANLGTLIAGILGTIIGVSIGEAVGASLGAIVGAGLDSAALGAIFGPVGLVVGAVLGAVIFAAISKINWSAVGKFLAPVGKAISSAFELIGKVIAIFGPAASQIIGAFAEVAERAFNKIGPQLVRIAKLFAPLGDALKLIGEIIKPIVEVVGVLLLALLLGIANVISHAIGPALNLLVDMFAGILTVITDVITGVVDLIEGKWGAAMGAFGAVGKDAAKLTKDVFTDIKDFFVGIFDGIKKAAAELYDVLFGHSIIPDIVEGFEKAFTYLGVVFGWLTAPFKAIGDMMGWTWTNVIDPVLQLFLGLWTKYIAPGVAQILNNLQPVFSAAIAGFKWVWDNIVLPVFNFYKSIYADYIKIGIDLVTGNLSKAWSDATAPFVDVWNNAIKPVFEKLKTIYDDYIKPGIGFVTAGISKAWSAATAPFVDIYNNDLKPVFTKLENIWTDHVKPGIQSIVDGLTGKSNPFAPIISAFESFGKSVGKGIVDGINFGIRGIDGIISGINAVSGLVGLPAIKPIDQITGLATGGMIPASKVNGGFITNGARAIVGEGNPAHPEFVIPTDPRFKNNAMKLLQQASHAMGISTPAYLSGGILGDAGDIVANGVKAAKNAAGTLTRGAIEAVFEPFKLAANALISKMPNKPLPVKDVLSGEMKNIQNWIQGVDNGASAGFKGGQGVGAAVGTAINASPGGTPTGTLTDWIHKAEKVLKLGTNWDNGFYNRIMFESTGNPNAINSNWQVDSNALHWHNAGEPNGGPDDWRSRGLVQVVPGTFAANSLPGYNSNIFDPVSNLIAGYRHDISKNGGLDFQGAATAGYVYGGQIPRVPVTAAKDGAYVTAHSGGSMLQVGEAGRDEYVAPVGMVPSSEAGSSGPTYNFYGDLSFPNITDGSHAQTFMDNLKRLGGNS